MCPYTSLPISEACERSTIMHKWFAHPWAVMLLVAVLLLAPLAVPNPALHIDEVSNWLDRAYGFRAAVAAGDWAATVRTEHPGVTTMALGGLGLAVLDAIAPGSGPLDLPTMYAVRYPVIIANVMALVAAYGLLRRLVNPRVALLAALLAAASPTLRWYLRLLHIDGMSTTFMWLSFVMLALALHIHTPRDETPVALPVRWGLLVAAGFVAGLAGLTRFTAVYLVGMIGVVVLTNLVYDRARLSVGAFLRGAVAPVLLFSVVLAVTWAALYPGMWADPAAVYAETVHGLENANSPHEMGNYYMGAPVEAPGAGFYGWALLIRVTPIVLFGVIAGGVAAFSGAMRDNWRLWLAVGVYIVVYALVMSSQPKKFDRYILPVFPALHLLAAFGWVWLYDALRLRWRGGQRGLRVVPVAAVVFIIGYGLYFFPKDYAYTNPLVGADRAQHILLIAPGGEGMEEVAEALAVVSGVEDARGQYVYTRYGDNLVYNLPAANIVRLQRMQVDVLGNAYYIVRTISYRQRDQWADPVFADAEPLHTVTIHGLTYAEIYDAEAIRAFIRAQGGEWPNPNDED